MDVKGKDVLVLKDKLSGFLYANITKDKSTKTTMKFFNSYFNMFGLPHRVVSSQFILFISAWV